MTNDLNFKIGSFKELFTSKTIKDGDVLFAKYDPDNQNTKDESLYLYVKLDGKLLPVSFSSAVWTSESSTPIGSSNQPVYINNNGQALACNSYAGGTALTLNGTSKTASEASIYAPTKSGTSTYILKSNGENNEPSWIQSIPVANGGTGKTSWTINSLIYASDTTTLTTSNHYIDGTKIAINSTSSPTENFYVNGSSKFNGKIIGSNSNYGTSLPTTNISTGQIYFKIIS